MKPYSLSFLLSALAFVSVQVAATPIRVIEISATKETGFSPFLLGHAAVNLPPVEPGVATPLTPHPHPHHHQQAGRPKKLSCQMRKQALKLSNWFRSQFGLPLIEHPHRKGKLQHPHSPRPLHGTAIKIIHVPMIPANASSVERMQSVKVNFIPHHHEWRPATFSGRLHQALMTLGPWEGRAMAFVLGCGIGSLIRMFWVLAVVAFRTSASRTERRIELIETEVVFEDLETPAAEPPRYDEKVEVQDVKTSSDSA